MQSLPKIRALRRRFASQISGAAAVEFALVLPALAALFVGISAFGLYLGAAHNLRAIAAEAARASVAGISDEERASLARQRVTTALTSGSLFKPGTVTVQVGPDPADATLYNVTLSVDSATLGLPTLVGLAVPPNFLTSSVSVRRGGL